MSDVNPKVYRSEIHEGEENDGPLKSVDLFLNARGLSLLINADIEGDVTYSFIVDGKHVQTGFIIQKTQINEP